MFQTNPGGVKLFSYLNTFFCSNKLCIAVATLKTLHRAFSFTSPAAMQIYWNKRNFLSKKRFNSQSAGLRHRRSHHFVVLGHQYGGLDVMCLRSGWALV